MFIPKGGRPFVTLHGLDCWNFPLTSTAGYSTPYTIFFTSHIFFLIFTVENHSNSSWYTGSIPTNDTVSLFWSYWFKEGWVQSALGRDSLSFQLMKCLLSLLAEGLFHLKTRLLRKRRLKPWKQKAKLKWRVMNSHFFPLIPRHMDPSNGRNNTRCGLFMAYAALFKTFCWRWPHSSPQLWVNQLNSRGLEKLAPPLVWKEWPQLPGVVS